MKVKHHPPKTEVQIDTPTELPNVQNFISQMGSLAIINQSSEEELLKKIKRFAENAYVEEEITIQTNVHACLRERDLINHKLIQSADERAKELVGTRYLPDFQGGREKLDRRYENSEFDLIKTKPEYTDAVVTLENQKNANPNFSGKSFMDSPIIYVAVIVIGILSETYLLGQGIAHSGLVSHWIFAYGAALGVGALYGVLIEIFAEKN